MRCNDITRGGGKKWKERVVSKYRRGCILRRVHDIDLHPSAAPSVFTRRERFRCGFPRHSGTPDVPSSIAVTDHKRSFRIGVTLRFVIAIASNRTWKMPSRATAFTRHSDLRSLSDLASDSVLLGITRLINR